MVAIYQYIHILIHKHICNVWCGDAMRWHYILLFLFLCAAAAPAAALNPVNVAVTSSNGWVIADNTDSAVITVRVTDGANNAIQDALMSPLISPNPGFCKDTGGKTDGNGKFVTTFLPTTKSGSAIITASVTVPERPPSRWFRPSPRTSLPVLLRRRRILIQALHPWDPSPRSRSSSRTNTGTRWTAGRI